jgi:hypothetical protein
MPKLVQTQYEGKEEASFLTFSPEKETLDLSTQVVYDLAIINVSESTTVTSIEELIKNLKPLLSADAFTFFIRHKDEAVGIRDHMGAHWYFGCCC